MSFDRGSFTGGRGRGSGSWRRGGPRGNRGFASNTSTIPTKPFGPEVDSIDIKTLLIEEEAPAIEHCKYVASYNWLDGREPVILVPG